MTDYNLEDALINGLKIMNDDKGTEAICPDCRMSFKEHEATLFGLRVGCREYYYGTNRDID